jgi:hypothetical protein
MSDPFHVLRWITALRAGLAKAPRCEGVTLTGEQCRQRCAKGYRRCWWHLDHRTRAKLDARQVSKDERTVRESVNAIHVRKAETRLRRHRRRLLQAAWENDPTIEGTTLYYVTDAELGVIAAHLKKRGVRIDAGWPPAMRDVLQVAAFRQAIAGTLDEVGMQAAIRRAERDRGRWRELRRKRGDCLRE